MGKDSTVAPKERVNIVYKPATGGAQEEKELPLKLLVMGDFTQQAEETPLEERKPVSVNKDNFDQALRSQKINLAMTVPNQFSGKEGEELSVKLKIEGLKDFSPEAIAQQVPELNKLFQLRTALQALKGPLGNIPSFRKKIEGLIGDEAGRDRLLKELGAGETKDS